MKTQDYKEILRAIEEAIEVCDQSTGFMDQVHRDMCEELRTIRSRLHRLINTQEAPSPKIKKQNLAINIENA
jgi:hypothetical protein